MVPWLRFGCPHLACDPGGMATTAMQPHLVSKACFVRYAGGTWQQFATQSEAARAFEGLSDGELSRLLRNPSACSQFTRERFEARRTPPGNWAFEWQAAPTHRICAGAVVEATPKAFGLGHRCTSWYRGTVLEPGTELDLPHGCP